MLFDAGASTLRFHSTAAHDDYLLTFFSGKNLCQGLARMEDHLELFSMHPEATIYNTTTNTCVCCRREEEQPVVYISSASSSTKSKNII